MPGHARGDARFVSYRRGDFEPEFTDQWYVASQMAADAALVQALLQPIALTNDAEVSPLRVGSAVPDDWDADDAPCYVEKSQLFLDRQWDYVNGGFSLARTQPERESWTRSATVTTTHSPGSPCSPWPTSLPIQRAASSICTPRVDRPRS